MSNLYKSIYNTNDIIDSGTVPVDNITIISNSNTQELEVGTVSNNNISDLDVSKITGDLTTVVKPDNTTIYYNSSGKLEIKNVDDAHISGVNSSKLSGNVPTSIRPIDTVKLSYDGTNKLTINQTYINQPLKTTSDVSFKNLSLSGNLTVSGNTTTINSGTFTITDAIAVFANDNTTTDINTLGIVWRNTSNFSGLYRNATNKAFYLMTSTTEIPTFPAHSSGCDNLYVKTANVDTVNINGQSLTSSNMYTLTAVDNSTIKYNANNKLYVSSINASIITNLNNNISIDGTTLHNNTSGKLEINPSYINQALTKLSSVTFASVNGADPAVNKSDISTLQGSVSALPFELTNLTTAEIQQLENIDLTTITTAQWSYIGNLDQALTKASDVVFNTINGMNPMQIKTNKDGVYVNNNNILANVQDIQGNRDNIAINGSNILQLFDITRNNQGRMGLNWLYVGASPSFGTLSMASIKKYTMVDGQNYIDIESETNRDLFLSFNLRGAGTNMSGICTTEYKNNAFYQWTKYNKLIFSYNALRDFSAHIDIATLDATGLYKCNALTVGGNNNANYTTNLYGGQQLNGGCDIIYNNSLDGSHTLRLINNSTGSAGLVFMTQYLGPDYWQIFSNLTDGSLTIGRKNLYNSVIFDNTTGAVDFKKNIISDDVITCNKSTNPFISFMNTTQTGFIDINPVDSSLRINSNVNDIIFTIGPAGDLECLRLNKVTGQTNVNALHIGGVVTGALDAGSYTPLFTQSGTGAINIINAYYTILNDIVDVAIRIYIYGFATGYTANIDIPTPLSINFTTSSDIIGSCQFQYTQQNYGHINATVGNNKVRLTVDYHQTYNGAPTDDYVSLNFKYKYYPSNVV